MGRRSAIAEQERLPLIAEVQIRVFFRICPVNLIRLPLVTAPRDAHLTGRAGSQQDADARRTGNGRPYFKQQIGRFLDGAVLGALIPGDVGVIQRIA